MKAYDTFMHDDPLSSLPPLQAIAPTPLLAPIPLLAPLWHTVAFLSLLAAWAGVSAQRTHDYGHAPHIATYLSMMMMTWMLFGSVVAGIGDRSAFFFATLRNSAAPFLTEVGRGLSVYLGVYASAVVIAMVIATGVLSYKAVHHALPAKATQAAPKSAAPKSEAPKSATSSAAPVAPPAPTAAEPVSPRAASKLHFDSKTVLEIAPRTPFELLLWLAISATAGFCEEHIFRGYLLKQVLALTQRAGLSRRLATLLSIVVTSLIFGSLHLYEGVGGAALIAVLGVVYSVVSLKLGNLRAVVIAHFLQDAVAGLFLFSYHSLHLS